LELANTYARINLDAILENYRNICKKAQKPVMAVVKADAYGHGAVAVARLLQGECPFFGVSSVAEALELRNAGIETPILILGHTPPQAYPVVVEKEIRTAIFSLSDARELSREAERQGKTAYIHLAVDTGMSRIGFQVNRESAACCKEIASLPGICCEGLFSHFARADEEDLTCALGQKAAYETFCGMLAEVGVTPKIRHLDNSAGIMNQLGLYDMTRAGIILYGLYPSDEVSRDKLAITPAMSWHSRVSHVKLLEKGRALSYGGTFVTDKPTLVATIPAGYADGYRRSLSNRFYVLIHGQKAPILGRVCMDQFMVDVTHIPQVQPGDPVVLMGTDGDLTITAEEIAAAAQSFNYEQVCDLSRRVSRVYMREGKEVFRNNYLL